MTRGLVIGKFYPPHAGHDHLLDVAQAGCDELTVLVVATSTEALDVELRAAWLRERHPAARILTDVCDLPIDYEDPDVWAAHVEVLRALCPEPVDVVFSSEEYGEELARRMGSARHVCVDLPRLRVPISGTAVRADVAAAWSHLGPAARAHFTRRVALVGAESTGTTTLTRALAERHRTAWVEEHGRVWTERLVAAGTPVEEIVWDDAAFLAIARFQQEDEDRVARTASPLMFCDTDALATCLWQERYVGRSTPEVEAVAADRTYALYALTGDEIPFVQDGVRDGEHLRAGMTERFRERLAAQTAPWIEVTGTVEERILAVEVALAALAPVRIG